jgi:hypothetical protein
MAANRVIRNWTDSEAMDSLSPSAEVFFTRLIMTVDDFGNFYANPKLLKGAMFPLKPYTDVQVAEWLDECLAAKSAEGVHLVIKYEVGGKTYIHINNFGQRKRSMKSKFPEPPATSAVSPSIVRESPPFVSTPPPEERKENREVEKEVEGESERSLAWFEKSCFDDLWLEQMKIVHPGKDVPRAIREAYAHLSSDKHRLKIIDPGGAKRLVNSWLSNTHHNTQKNGKNIRNQEPRRTEPVPGKSFGKL